MNPDLYPLQSPLSSRPAPSAQWLGRTFIACLVLVCLVFLGLTFWGYGKLSIVAPANSVIYVNGHRVDSNNPRLRLGTYKIVVYSPTTKAVETKASVGLWPTTIKPLLPTRNPDAILSSVIGAAGTYGVPSFGGDAKWLESNTWLVGAVGPGSATPIALYYRNGHWAVGYYAAPGYTQSLNTLPSDVASQIHTVEATYAG